MLIRRFFGLAALFLLYGGFPAASAEAPQTLEYPIKAALVFNFLQFIDWPADAAPSGQIRICILGESRFNRHLAERAGDVVQGKLLEVKKLNDSPQAGSEQCDVVYFASGSHDFTDAALSGLNGKPVLTIGEEPDFLDKGGIINFFIQDEKVAFSINRAAAEKSGLNISSKLLRVAKEVRE